MVPLIVRNGDRIVGDACTTRESTALAFINQIGIVHVCHRHRLGA